MAANPKTLRIVGAEMLGPETRALDVECIDAEPLLAGRGKYIILATGAVADGRPVKRAYSLVPVSGAPQRARLTVKRIGTGSGALHDAALGTELTFSGPWGKLVPGEQLEPRALVVATDTGITTALGLLAQAPFEVLWLRAEDDRFLEVATVRARLEAAGVRSVHAPIPPAKDPRRLAVAWAHIDARIAEAAAEVVVAAGDGAIVHPLRERLGGKVRDVRIECFFHNPERKSPA